MSDICQHGKPLYADPSVYCRECEIAWYRDCLNDATRRVASYSEKLRKLEGKESRWVAVPEQTEHDNFYTSIYENDYKGLLVARCNQNGSHPWQAAAIIRGLEKNKELPTEPAKTGDSDV